MNGAEAIRDTFLTVSEVQELAGCSRSHAYAIVREVGFRPGPAGCFRIALERYLEQRSRRAGDREDHPGSP